MDTLRYMWSQVQMQRLYRRADSCRECILCAYSEFPDILLVRYTHSPHILVRATKERDLSPGDVKFNRTAEERHISYVVVMIFSTSINSNYSAGQSAIDRLHCNITQDQNLIAMAVALCLHRPPASSTGIDRMKLKARRNVQVFRRSFSSTVRP
jgi:hypothetical protein